MRAGVKKKIGQFLSCLLLVWFAADLLVFNLSFISLLIASVIIFVIMRWGLVAFAYFLAVYSCFGLCIFALVILLEGMAAFANYYPILVICGILLGISIFLIYCLKPKAPDCPVEKEEKRQ